MRVTNASYAVESGTERDSRPTMMADDEHEQKANVSFGAKSSYPYSSSAREERFIPSSSWIHGQSSLLLRSTLDTTGLDTALMDC